MKQMKRDTVTMKFFQTKNFYFKNLTCLLLTIIIFTNLTGANCAGQNPLYCDKRKETEKVKAENSNLEYDETGSCDEIVDHFESLCNRGKAKFSEVPNKYIEKSMKLSEEEKLALKQNLANNNFVKKNNDIRKNKDKFKIKESKLTSHNSEINDDGCLKKISELQSKSNNLTENMPQSSKGNKNNLCGDHNKYEKIDDFTKIFVSDEELRNSENVFEEIYSQQDIINNIEAEKYSNQKNDEIFEYKPVSSFKDIISKQDNEIAKNIELSEMKKAKPTYKPYPFNQNKLEKIRTQEKRISNNTNINECMGENKKVQKSFDYNILELIDLQTSMQTLNMDFNKQLEILYNINVALNENIIALKQNIFTTNQNIYAVAMCIENMLLMNYVALNYPDSEMESIHDKILKRNENFKFDSKRMEELKLIIEELKNKQKNTNIKLNDIILKIQEQFNKQNNTENNDVYADTSVIQNATSSSNQSFEDKIKESKTDCPNHHG